MTPPDQVAAALADLEKATTAVSPDEAVVIIGAVERIKAVLWRRLMCAEGNEAAAPGEATAEGAASRFGLGVPRPRTGAEQPTPPPAQSPLKDRYQTDEWLKPKEAAALLGVSPEFVKRKLRHLSHKLSYKVVRYKKADLEKWAVRK